MKRWIQWAAWLYPAEWRLRYGAEFDVFLADIPLRWSDFADVIRGAAIMRMTSWMTYWKMALLGGLVGALIAAGIAFAIPNRWVCTSTLVVDGGSGTHQALRRAEEHVLSSDALIGRKDIQVMADAHEGSVEKVRIVFSYPDRFKAKAVVDRLTAEFLKELGHIPGGPASSLLENPIPLERPTSPLRLAYVSFGLIAGILTGLLSLAIWRRTRTYAVVTASIPRDTKQFVDSQIATGPYRSVSEYVGELIRADQQRHH